MCPPQPCLHFNTLCFLFQRECSRMKIFCPVPWFAWVSCAISDRGTLVWDLLPASGTSFGQVLSLRALSRLRSTYHFVRVRVLLVVIIFSSGRLWQDNLQTCWCWQLMDQLAGVRECLRHHHQSPSQGVTGTAAPGRLSAQMEQRSPCRRALNLNWQPNRRSLVVTRLP